MVAKNREFDRSLRCLITPALMGLARELDGLGALGQAERAAVLAGATETLAETVHRKLSRLLVLELNAARDAGTLSAPTSAARWTEFVERAAQPRFWRSLGAQYPTLAGRLDAIVSGRCAAAGELARRFAADRLAIAALTSTAQASTAQASTALGELSAVSFGQGDSHRGGRSVALLRVDDRQLIYKPRSLAVDDSLHHLLDLVFGDHRERIRVPRVVLRDGYGWSEFVEHTYCCTPEELRRYYTGIGHWLAIARLFGTTDLHAENLIAHGPVPVIVDCETLFTPWLRMVSAKMGEATDLALRTLCSTVLMSGLLPGRGSQLGWRGADISAIGALPGQQPTLSMPQIVGAGTDQARIASVAVPVETTANLPSPQPELERYWPDILDGFDALTARLIELDSAGRLAPAMAAFGNVEVRAVVRPTESYAELTRMLWHPVSLHDEPAAVARVTALLSEHARSRPTAPSDPKVIAAEVAELLQDDIPVFRTTARHGLLTGPAGTSWGEPHDLIGEALTSWRSADLLTERELIRTSAVSAYSGDSWRPQQRLASVPAAVEPDYAGKAGALAESVLSRIMRAAVWGADGSVTWISPVLNATGWSVQPLSLDGYSGTAGVALALAGYRREVFAGRARSIDGLEQVLSGTVQTMRLTHDRTMRIRADSRFTRRPDVPGLYIGLGSQIWSWLWLVRLGVGDEDGLERAVALAELLPAAVAASAEPDLLVGAAGSITALLMLAEQTADSRWLEQAGAVGDRLVAAASWSAGTARWLSPRAPDGLGGFAHGSTGIGWSLARLSVLTGNAAFAKTAEAAFAFEESLYQPAQGNWRDLRELAASPPAWCHGAVGIGLAAADLMRLGFSDPAAQSGIIRRAAAACWNLGMGWNHSLCHGDLGCWELLQTAFDLHLEPAGLQLEEVAGQLLAGIDKHGPVSGLARDAFSPGLLPGLSGVAYQLLRMNPSCELA
ncbi:MAG: type 2 lanthipeptide synthetase LanM family protein [Jatrophihabitantaceae bacterium]